MHPYASIYRYMPDRRRRIHSYAFSRPTNIISICLLRFDLQFQLHRAVISHFPQPCLPIPYSSHRASTRGQSQLSCAILRPRGSRHQGETRHRVAVSNNLVLSHLRDDARELEAPKANPVTDDLPIEPAQPRCLTPLGVTSLREHRSLVKGVTKTNRGRRSYRQVIPTGLES